MKIYMEILVSIRVIVFSKNKSQQSLDDIIESAVKDNWWFGIYAKYTTMKFFNVKQVEHEEEQP